MEVAAAATGTRGGRATTLLFRSFFSPRTGRGSHRKSQPNRRRALPQVRPCLFYTNPFNPPSTKSGGHVFAANAAAKQSASSLAKQRDSSPRRRELPGLPLSGKRSMSWSSRFTARISAGAMSQRSQSRFQLTCRPGLERRVAPPNSRNVPPPNGQRAPDHLRSTEPLGGASTRRPSKSHAVTRPASSPHPATDATARDPSNRTGTPLDAAKTLQISIQQRFTTNPNKYRVRH